ncbi:MAG: helix-turn-helix domain-containing protein [Brumimicrobium sp.]|nr:helix-turn-helix domain-containing protein [Brumimicrobium sp.]
MVLNTSEVAKLLNLSTRQVQYLVDKGEIAPLKKFHRYYIFDKEQIVNYKTQRDERDK